MGISKRELLILASLMVMAAVLYIFVLQPMAKERASLTAEAKRLTRESQKIEQTLKAVPRGREGLAEVRSRMEKIRTRLLPPGGISSLFSEVSRPGKRLGVRIVSFTPKGPDPAKYGEVSADLVVEGTYLALGQYLEELFGGQYLISVDDLKMSALKQGEPHLRMHMILKSWMQQEAR
ncbi:MAG: type 4a pilus biogenesis protein PilO [candidate division NC10 bacterium]